jgi:septal ring factor EnvC (AmiA/AmiB activator)
LSWESRFTSSVLYFVRFSVIKTIKVPVDQRGKIIHPVDTDDLVLQVCNTKLGLDIIKTDIGRSHVIGKVNKGRLKRLEQQLMPYVSENEKLRKQLEENTKDRERLEAENSRLRKRISTTEEQNLCDSAVIYAV